MLGDKPQRLPKGSPLHNAHEGVACFDAGPEWFEQALLTPVQTGSVEVDGAEITYRSWGPPGPAGLLLVHGGAAHARWWDHIAPLLAAGRRVVAIDLSGHGDSGRRDRYLVRRWGDEIMAVVQDAGLGRATVVGHSLGGLVTLHVASRSGHQLAGAVAIDCPVGEASPADRAAAEARAYAPARVHEDRRALAARFRPLPDQEMLPYVRNHIAETSIRAADGGWSWKFDPAVFRNDIELPEFTSPGCPVVLVRAERGMLTAPLAAGIVDRLEHPVPVVELPDAGHAPMLDQPLALVAVLRTLLETWSPT